MRIADKCPTVIIQIDVLRQQLKTSFDLNPCAPNNFITNNVVSNKYITYFCAEQQLKIMENKPFIFGIATSGDNFTDREKETERLLLNFRHGVNTVLISSRRWGKTSLVQKACRLAQSDKLKIVYLDIFSCRSDRDFYDAFASAVLKQTSSKVDEWLENIKLFLSRISPKISMGADPMTDFSISLEIDPKSNDSDEILQLPEKIAQKKGCNIVVCIDEFQQLALLPGYKSMEGKMRSAWQKQQQVSYCFYGSKRHMMMDIFNNSSNPFYRFGQVLFLQKIKKEEWVPFIVNAFHRTNKEISEQQAEQLCDIVKCHSWYLQQLCYFIWSGTSEKVTDEIIEIRTRQLIDTNMPMFMNDTENLTAAQTAMLRAVADGEYRFNSIPVVRKYELGSAQTITRNKRMLTERDFIEKEGNKYAFSDPIFELWFRREYC